MRVAQKVHLLAAVTIAASVPSPLVAQQLLAHSADAAVAQALGIGWKFSAPRAELPDRATVAAALAALPPSPSDELVQAAPASATPDGDCSYGDCEAPTYDLWVTGASLSESAGGDSATVRIENHGAFASPVALLVVAARPPGVTLAAAAAGPTTRAEIPSVAPGGSVVVRIPIAVPATTTGAPSCILATVYMPGDPEFSTAPALAAASP